MRVGTAYLAARLWAWRWKGAAVYYRIEWRACLANWNAAADERDAAKSALAAALDRIDQLERADEARKDMLR